MDYEIIRSDHELLLYYLFILSMYSLREYSFMNRECSICSSYSIVYKSNPVVCVI